MRAGSRLALGSLMLAACTKVSTDPNTVLSIEFQPRPSPSVVAGDSLRDTTGTAAPVRAQAFNEKGDPITDANIVYLTTDTIITVSPNGFVFARAFRDNAPRVFATIGSLQVVDTVPLTLRPDTILPSPTKVLPQLPQPRDTLRATDSVAVAAVVVQNRDGTTLRPVKQYIVSYQVEFRGQLLPPTDQTVAWLVDDRARVSWVDTTDASGLSSRTVRVRPAAITNPIDSIIVRATTKYRRAVVTGRPVRMVYITKR